MIKPDFCICENKGADQLRGNREADQRLCFRYTDSTISLLSKSEDRFSQNEAHIYLTKSLEKRVSQDITIPNKNEMPYDIAYNVICIMRKHAFLRMGKQRRRSAAQ